MFNLLNQSKYLLVFCLLAISLLFAQVDTAWVRRYNGTGNGEDCAKSIVVDNAGNVYVTGYSVGTGTSFDYVTIKYDSLGNEQWVVRYNGSGDTADYGYDLAIDNSGNVYVTGAGFGLGSDFDYVTIKYDPAGNERWVRYYNGTGDSSDYGQSIVVDNSGNVYITGYSIGLGSSYDYVTIKYDSLGNEQWVVRYNGTGDSIDYAYELAIDDSGNVYVTGASRDSINDYDFLTIKYNPSGVEQWVARGNFKPPPYPGDDWAYGIAVDGSGNVYVTGKSWAGPSPGYDYITVKYNPSGVEQWYRWYNGYSPGDDDVPYDIAVDGSGNVYVTGASGGGPATNSGDYATIKYDSSGNQEWVARYNYIDYGDDEARALVLDNMGNIYVTGGSAGSLPGYQLKFDYATVKYNSSGDEQWVMRYNGPGDTTDCAYGIAVDGVGNVYVTGRSFAWSTNYDYCTIKYTQPGGITESKVQAESSVLLEVTPNPFYDKIEIKWRLQDAGYRRRDMSVKIYDISGRVVKLFNHLTVQPINYVFWDATDNAGRRVASGTYFVVIKDGEEVLAKQAVYVR